jgi:hypothetical protein
MVRLHGAARSIAVERYRRELAASKVAGLERLAIGWLEASVTAPDDLAHLPSWWCELAGAVRPLGGPWLLGEVAQRIAFDTLPDPSIALQVRALHSAWQVGAVAIPTLELIRRIGGYQVADGNKRAAAILLSGEAVIVPAVVVELPPDVRVSPC